jgi:hypothetical protein
VFRTVVCLGQGGAILWGDGEAAALARWTIVRDESYRFTLRGTISRSDRYRLRQVPLRFAAPRRQKPAGFWCFPVLPQTVVVNGDALTASLGPPEGR